MLGEFLGTLTLIVLGCGVGAGLNLNKTMAHGQSDWFYVTFAWGIAVTMGVYVAASFGAQGHLNPAVTIAFAVAGTFPWCGALSGWAVLRSVFGCCFSHDPILATL